MASKESKSKKEKEDKKKKDKKKGDKKAKEDKKKRDKKSKDGKKKTKRDAKKSKDGKKDTPKKSKEGRKVSKKTKDDEVFEGPKTLADMKEKYKIYSTVLGKGAFSEVRLGMNRTTGDKVAIKIIDKKNVSDNFKKNLEREIKILKQVQHENIVCLRDMYNSDTKFLFVMELADGGELFDRIVDKGSYSEEDAKQLVSRIIAALEYLHGKGIAHRDLKPENLLLSSKTSDYDVKIADFGLSSYMAEETLMQTACGTPAYVAPEVLTGGYDTRVDMWSIGVITYILLCGFPPFYADSVKGLLKIVAKGEYKFPSPYWDEISPQAKDFIRQLLCAPEKRMTATEAKSHPWLKSNGSRVESISFRDHMKNYVFKRRGERKNLPK